MDIFINSLSSSIIIELIFSINSSIIKVGLEYVK